MHLGYKDLLQRAGLVRDNFFDFQFIGNVQNRWPAPATTWYSSDWGKPSPASQKLCLS